MRLDRAHRRRVAAQALRCDARSAGPSEVGRARTAVGRVARDWLPFRSFARTRGACFYTETAGDAQPHVIDKNMSMLKAIGIRTPDLEFPLDEGNPRAAADARSRLGVPAGRASRSSTRARRGRTSAGRRCISPRWRVRSSARYDLRSLVLWGPGEEQLAHDIVAASDGAAAVSPQTTRCRSRGAAQGVGADDLRRHRADAHCRRVGHAAGGHFRPDRSATERTVGGRRPHRLPLSQLRLPLSARMPHLGLVPARHRATRSDGSGRAAAPGETCSTASPRCSRVCGCRSGFSAAAAVIWLSQPTATIPRDRRPRCRDRRNAAHLGGGPSRQGARSDAIRTVPDDAASSLCRLRDHRRGPGHRLGAWQRGGVDRRLHVAIAIGSAIRHEEASMRAAFGDEYEAYAESRRDAGRASVQLRAGDEDNKE